MDRKEKSLSVYVFLFIAAFFVYLMPLNFHNRVKKTFISGWLKVYKAPVTAYRTTAMFFNVQDDIHKLNSKLTNLKTENKKILINQKILLSYYQKGEYVPPYKDVKEAKVLYYSGDLYSYAYINKGTSAGLKIFSPVIFERAGQVYLYGRIAEVYEHSAKVMLLTNKEFKISAYIKNKEQIILAAGAGGFEIDLKYVFKNYSVNKGDIVYSFGDEMLIPSDLIIGEVISITENQNELEKQVRAELKKNPLDIRNVFILMNNENDFSEENKKITEFVSKAE